MSYKRKTVDIIISEDLRTILSNIRSQSVVADKLLKRRVLKEEVVENHINYISVSSSDNTKISYLTKERIESLNPSEYWTSSRRFQVKPGVLVSKILKDIHPKSIEEFANLFKSETTKQVFTFEVVKGERIRDFYLWENYAHNDSGSLGISCMKHDSCQKLLDIYCKNENQVSMLAMLDKEGLLLGRAILWNIDKNKIMDRIYTVNDNELPLQFKKWATDNGYLYKSNQNWASTLQFENLKTQKREIELSFDLESKKFRYYPYMDTFKFLDVNGIVYNYHPKNVEFYTLATCDGGKYEQDYFKLDDIDRVFRHRSECVWLDYLKINTHDGNTYWSRANDCHILKKDAVYNNQADDYIFNEEYNQLNNWVDINKRIDKLNSRNQITVSISTMFSTLSLSHI
jgi:hypothetical protein